MLRIITMANVYGAVFFFFKFFLLIYNVILASGVQQSDPIIHISILFRFFSVIDYYKILSRVPRAIQYVLVG